MRRHHRAQTVAAQLLQAQKLESVGQLAAGIAHEINTPTQYIGDNVRFLKDSFQDLRKLLADYDELLSATKSDALSSETIQRVATAVALADAPYLLEEIPRAIDSTITVARNEWKYVAELETDFDSSLPLILCQPGEFNQVILNLIVNAAQAIAEANKESAREKGRITVRTLVCQGWAEIRIHDNGSGIPEKIQTRIFDPFFTTKEIGKGTGQGLAISRSVVVDKHGGTIHFETEEGNGTTFIVRLPLGDPAFTASLSQSLLEPHLV